MNSVLFNPVQLDWLVECRYNSSFLLLAVFVEGQSPMAKKPGKDTPPVTPASLAPHKALELLRRQVDRGRQLLANRPITSAADRAWETATRDVLTRAYGSRSPNVDSVMGVGRYRNVFGGGNEQEWEQGRAEDMQARLTILEELIGLLEDENGHKPAAPIVPVPIPVGSASPAASALDGEPKDVMPVTAFISYSWDSEPHKEWVRRFADDLIRNGVDTILDQYDLAFGHDRFRFMESSVRRADVVLCVCTPDYVQRANEREKGVGVETSLITPKFFEENKAKQFIPIIRVKHKGIPPTPDYMSALIFVDFGNDAEFSERLEELLRHLHRQPKVKKPPLGSVPNFGSSPSGKAAPPRPAPIMGSSKVVSDAPVYPLSVEAKQILAAASESNDGFVHFVTFDGGFQILTNERRFVPENKPREAANWKHGFDQLLGGGLLVASEQESVFRVTKKGYETSKELLDND